MFSVLVHPDLYQRLRRARRPLRARVHRVLARLRDGRWGGGTRVKRLRGVAHPVYEARTDRGDRLLFTISRWPADGDPHRLAPHLEIWDLVEHDDVLRAARRSRAAEAEFLELPVLEEFDIAEPPPRPDAPFIAAADDDGAGLLLHFLLPDSNPVPEEEAAAADGLETGGGGGGGRTGQRGDGGRHRASVAGRGGIGSPAEGGGGAGGGGETGAGQRGGGAGAGADLGAPATNVRWFRVDPAWLVGEQDFQRLLDQGGDELELKLFADQYQVLQSPGPVLVAGSAGSGKTTLAVHRLAAAALTPGCGPALYLSYSAALVEHARRLYDDLLAANPPNPPIPPNTASIANSASSAHATTDGRTLAAAGGVAARRPDFYTFDDLYRSLLHRDFADHQGHPAVEAAFLEWFRRAGRPLDPALVWEELRSIVKGACLALEPGAMLPAEEYFELGRKRAPLFVELRPEIYRIAERYQQWLAEEGRLDSIDLCRLALAALRRRRTGPYAVVVCDEIQDLTEVEVAFVLGLAARSDLAGVLLTGDAQQIVNPSGFRWAEVRRLAGRRTRQRAAPDVVRLRRNVRGTRPLVELANALLEVRREVYGRGEEGDGEEPASAGPVPVEALGSEAELSAVVAGLGPRSVVLTLDADTAAAVGRRLGTSRVLSVQQAKGLEFDTVVTWKLLAPPGATGTTGATGAEDDLVDRFLRGDARLEREPRFARLLRLLYVAVTRARRHLAIYEGEAPHPFWGRGPLAGRLERQPAATLARLFRATAAPAEWASEGELFTAHGHHRQAAECFRRAGCPEREAAALARADEARQDWVAALGRWQGLGAAGEQAPLLERLGRFAEAAARYREAGCLTAARRCELLQLEGRQAWREAALGWEALGEDAAAARCYAAAGERRAAAAAAARAAQRAGDWATAGAGWLEIGEHQLAARCLAAAGDRAGEGLAAALGDQAAGRWAAAAAGFRRAGRQLDARRCLARAHEERGSPRRAARQWLRLGERGRALEQLVAAGSWLEVARLEAPAAAGGRRALARAAALVEAGDWLAALPLLAARRQALAPELPEVPWFLAEEPARRAAAELLEIEAVTHRAQAVAAEQQGAWSRASRRWRLAGDAADRRRATAALARRIAALSDPLRRVRAWWLLGEHQRAAAEAARHDRLGIAVAALAAESEGCWDEAAALWRSLARRTDAARCLARAAGSRGDWTAGGGRARLGTLRRTPSGGTGAGGVDVA